MAAKFMIISDSIVRRILLFIIMFDSWAKPEFSDHWLGNQINGCGRFLAMGYNPKP